MSFPLDGLTEQKFHAYLLSSDEDKEDQRRHQEVTSAPLSERSEGPNVPDFFSHSRTSWLNSIPRN